MEHQQTSSPISTFFFFLFFFSSFFFTSFFLFLFFLHLFFSFPLFFLFLFFFFLPPSFFFLPLNFVPQIFLVEFIHPCYISARFKIFYSIIGKQILLNLIFSFFSVVLEMLPWSTKENFNSGFQSALLIIRIPRQYKKKHFSLRKNLNPNPQIPNPP